MVKAIVFDFWGTLVEQGVWSPIKQIKEILKLPLPFEEYIIRMEHAFMTKEFSDLKSAFGSLCQEFGVDEAKIDELVGLWNKSWMLAYPYPETEQVLKRLRKKYPLFLISNTDPFSIDNVLDKFQLRGLFDKIFFSYKLGFIKTDAQFLDLVLEELGLPAEECLLIGDSIQSDIIPAKEKGLKAVLIDRKNSRNFHPKIKRLDDLEKIL